MYKVKKELPADRGSRRKENRTKEQVAVLEQRNVLIGKVMTVVNYARILHPTKGWRERNLDRQTHHEKMLAWMRYRFAA